MVYRNYKIRYSIKNTIAVIISSIFIIFIIGNFIYDYNQPLTDTTTQMKDRLIVESQPSQKPAIIIYTSPSHTSDLNGYGVTPYGKSNEQSQQIISYSLDQLRLIVLNDINNYRTQNGLSPLPMDNAKASQVWANHLLEISCLQHRDGNSGPMQRYVDNGDKLQMVFENLASQSGSNLDPMDGIKKANIDMMFNDADQGNSHRYNILNQNHKSVSLGIAYNNNNLVLVEDFQEPVMGNWKSFDLAYDDGKSCW